VIISQSDQKDLKPTSNQVTNTQYTEYAKSIFLKHAYATAKMPKSIIVQTFWKYVLTLNNIYKS